MDFLLLLRRNLLVSALVGLGAAVSVYFCNEWWFRLPWAMLWASC